MYRRARAFSDRIRTWKRAGSTAAAGVLAVALLASDCGKIVEMRAGYSPASPRAAYEQALASTGLARSAMGASWHRVADEALAMPTEPDVPYREAGYFDPAETPAGAFRVPLRRGQRVVAEAFFAPPDSGRIFLDLFREMTDRGLGMRRVASSDSTQILTYDATANATYVLRIQPELLAGGMYELSIRTQASIIFPVIGKDSRAIQSVFGDPRDGGQRSHHGVDIFAPRGTPVIAAVDGVVSSTRVGGLGGKTVWLRSSKVNGNLYYAHLSKQLVRRGQRVSAGDTLGLVGNTGNARTTPPHLHFGIYSNGPVDPLPFVHRPDQDPSPILADARRAGSWMRTSVEPTIVRNGPGRRAVETAVLQTSTSLLILAASSRSFRVRLPNGTTGYLGALQVESEEQPLENRILASATPVRRAPRNDSTPVGVQPPGNEIRVLGRFGGYARVSTGEGRPGWILDR